MPKIPKTYFAQRLPDETIAGIETLAKRWGCKKAPVIVRAIDESLNHGTAKSPAGGCRRTPRPQATAVRSPILRPNGKL